MIAFYLESSEKQDAELLISSLGFDLDGNTTQTIGGITIYVLGYLHDENEEPLGGYHVNIWTPNELQLPSGINRKYPETPIAVLGY